MKRKIDIIFQADVGRKAGLGHLRESISLAQEFRRQNIESVFILSAYLPQAIKILQETQFEVIRADNIQEVFKQTNAKGIISNLVDSPYRFKEQILTVTNHWALITEHQAHEVAPINFNICLHPEFFPLNENYTQPKPHLIHDSVEDILLCFGGSDPKNVTGLILEMLRQGLERKTLSLSLAIDVVLGPLFEHQSVLLALQTSYPVKLKVSGPVTPLILKDMLQKADIGLTTGGGTMIEFCALGLPTIVIPVLDKMDTNAQVLANRQAIVKTERVDRLTSESLCHYLCLLSEKKLRTNLSLAAQQLIDGQGAQRMANYLIKEWRLK